MHIYLLYYLTEEIFLTANIKMRSITAGATFSGECAIYLPFFGKGDTGKLQHPNYNLTLFVGHRILVTLQDLVTKLLSSGA